MKVWSTQQDSQDDRIIWNGNNIAIGSMIRLIHSWVMSIFLYAFERWTITANIDRRIQALEMRCSRKLLGISYRDHKINKEVKTRIENTIGSYEDVLISVKRHKLKWYGHATQSCGLAKTILQAKQYKEGTKRQTENDGKTISESGRALNGTSYCGKLRTSKSGGSWL